MALISFAILVNVSHDNHRYTAEILEDARSISEHAGKKQIDEADLQFAIDNAGLSLISSFTDNYFHNQLKIFSSISLFSHIITFYDFLIKFYHCKSYNNICHYGMFYLFSLLTANLEHIFNTARYLFHFFCRFLEK